MEWYNLFRQHILDRGAEYYQDGYVEKIDIKDGHITAKVEGTNLYSVDIDFDGEEVVYMTCDCPYAEEGNNCKHMAAVLFKFEEILSDEDEKKDDFTIEEFQSVSLEEALKRRKEKIKALVDKIPENEIKKLLVEQILNDDTLRNKLLLLYSEKIDAKQILMLKEEVDAIVRDNSVRGFIDWYHALDFTSELQCFLNSKVKILIERNMLDAAFDLTNYVFHCIGNIAMDDSDGSSSYVADNCYECWKLILEKCSCEKKKKIKKWFEEHQDGYVIDFMEEYIHEFYNEEFLSDEDIRKKIMELDEILSDRDGSNDCSSIYSIRYGYENVIIKRIEYMKKLKCSEHEIDIFLKKNRHFFTVREIEIEKFLQDGDYKEAERVLIESKKLDTDYPAQMKKYSEKLIKIYDIVGDESACADELLYYMKNFQEAELDYFLKLKSMIKDEDEWNKKVEEIISENRNDFYVCEILNEEKRYQELINRIKKSFNKIYLLDLYEKNIKKTMGYEVIKIYQEYIKEEIERVSNRKGYRHVVKYLDKIKRSKEGKKLAQEIADSWRIRYKRRTALMDELRKIGL